MNTRPMSKHKRIMRERLNEAWDYATCGSVLDCTDGVCVRCRDSAVQETKAFIERRIAESKLYLEAYGFTVTEGD